MFILILGFATLCSCVKQKVSRSDPNLRRHNDRANKEDKGKGYSTIFDQTIYMGEYQKQPVVVCSRSCFPVFNYHVKFKPPSTWDTLKEPVHIEVSGN